MKHKETDIRIEISISSWGTGEALGFRYLRGWSHGERREGDASSRRSHAESRNEKRASDWPNETLAERRRNSGGTGAGTTAADVIFTLSALLFFFYLFYFFDLFLLVLIKFHFHETYIIFFLIYRLTRRVTEKKKIVHKIRYFIHTIALLTPFSMIKLICQNAIFVAYLLFSCKKTTCSLFLYRKRWSSV